MAGSDETSARLKGSRSDVDDTAGRSLSGERQPIARAQDQLFAPGTSSRAKYAALVVGRP